MYYTGNSELDIASCRKWVTCRELHGRNVKVCTKYISASGNIIMFIVVPKYQ